MSLTFKDLLVSVDMLNTVNGGVSEPYISHRENNEGRELRIRVPGVKKESMHIEIKDNQLSIFYLIPMQAQRKLVHMTQIIFSQVQPHFIELPRISASYEGNELVVKLPFNNLSGYNRKVEIGEE